MEPHAHEWAIKCWNRWLPNYRFTFFRVLIFHHISSLRTYQPIPLGTCLCMLIMLPFRKLLLGKKTSNDRATVCSVCDFPLKACLNHNLSKCFESLFPLPVNLPVNRNSSTQRHLRGLILWSIKGLLSIKNLKWIYILTCEKNLR